MRAIIWPNDGRIIVKRPRMLSTQFVALYKPCKPKHRLRRIYASLGFNEVRPRKIMTCQAPGDFLIKLVFWIFNLQWEYYVLRLFFFSKALIYGGYLRFPESWGRQHCNWFPILTEFRIYPLAAVCSIWVRSNIRLILVLWIKQSYLN